MKPTAFDTNAYAAFKRSDADVMAIVREAPEIVVSATLFGELLADFAFGAREAANRLEFRCGKPLATNDLWIAASALEPDAALLTLDTHFAHSEGIGRTLADFTP